MPEKAINSRLQANHDLHFVQLKNKDKTSK